jgi:sulfite exporter TauE/SafE
VEDASDAAWMAALAMGLLGSSHCVGMCGGIAGALGRSADQSPGALAGLGQGLRSQLALNAGRIASYALMGALAGALGLGVASALGPMGRSTLRLVFAALIVLVGLHVAGWWAGGASFIERPGAWLWARISPLTARIGPADRLWKRVALGGVWGWLPCGLVYAALASAAVAGTAAGGALFMVCFGLGTLPAVVATGVVAGRVEGLARHAGARGVAGALMVAFGVWTAWGAVGMGGHGAHAPASTTAPDAAGEHTEHHHH